LALVVLILLGGVMWWTSRGGVQGPETPPAWIGAIDQADVTHISIKTPQGEAELRRSGIPDLWTLTSSTWQGSRPVRGERFRGLMRLLADLDALPGEAGAALAPGELVSVTVAGPRTGERRVEFQPGAFGGRALARLGPDDARRVVLADARIPAAFTPESLNAWGEGSLSVSLATEPSTIEVHLAGKTLRLQRRQTRWTVAAPVVAPGDSEAVRQLLAQLTTVEARSPLASAVDVGDSPLCTVRIDTDVRVLDAGDVSSRVLRQEVTLANLDPVTSQADGVASAWWLGEKGDRTPAWGPTPVRVNGGAIGLVTSDPGPFFSRQAIDQPAADVRVLWIGPENDPARRITLSRTLDQWSVAGPEGEAGATSEQAGHIAALVKLIAESRASAASIEPPPAVSSVATVAFVLGGEPAATLEFGTAYVKLPNTGMQEVLVIRTGEISRMYSAAEHAATIEWLRSVQKPAP